MNAENGIRASYGLANFSLREMSECGKTIRIIGEGATSMEETANRIVRHLYDGLTNMEGERASVLVRFFKTHPFHDLEGVLQGFAGTLLGDAPPYRT